jgi:hypothetical protein
MDAPLQDLIVLDLSRVPAGPFASMTLADLGARVIKVEQPGTGDEPAAFRPSRKAKAPISRLSPMASSRLRLILKPRVTARFLTSFWRAPISCLGIIASV